MSPTKMESCGKSAWFHDRAHELQLAKLRGLIEELTTRNGGAIEVDTTEGAL